mmetsp:Transcript_22607/g.49349  ORF Transcript_22607/g.49349 Transcript_22607/m.49349 type:complete len:749 (+) Transcript_22607:96-2342(+)|eukprot:CAMPEP_0168727294 /NCGR_PEP_ID=MMETSP0724-20121128/5105_1 /TAXON_ID=265536 /ORGANISM="Amphiprora sp., Strain CCMP467" /LENGTH=748 /DNA_ID=CAMNT_0008774125 /DNA_START=18 /DNA_END=2264 /DNA_ORIENTATION=+
MVIPSLKPTSDDGVHHAVSPAKPVEPAKQTYESMQQETRDTAAHSDVSKDEGAQNAGWLDFIFGPSGEDTKRELEQRHENQNQHYLPLQEGREGVLPTSNTEEQKETGERNSPDSTHIEQEEQSQTKDEAFPQWLSWLDPTSGAACSSSNGPPASASNSYKEQEQDQEQEQKPARRLIDPPAEDTASVGSSVEESKVFRDLDSVGSSTRAGTIPGSIKTTDLDLQDGGSSTVGTVTESVVGKKLESLKTPRKSGFKSVGAAERTKEKDEKDEKADTVKSLESRRQLLVNELRSTISSHGRYDVKTANISAALGDLLDESKKHDQSIKLHRDAVEIYSSKLGDDHPTTMEAKLRLGKVLENSGKMDEAINVYFLVTAMRKAINGEKDPTCADSLVLLAHALRKKDDFHQAIKELKRALKIYREALGDSHTKVSSTVDEIASLYVTIGDFEKSAAILEEVVKLKAVTQGMQSRAVATTLCSLATTYECSEDFTKAMKSLKKAYKIYTELDGYSSKEATNALNRIAQLYEATGDHDRASIAYLGVIRGRKINFGDDHLEVAETYYRLGHALRESGQYDKALKCLKEGLPIFVNKGVEVNDVKMIAEVMHEMALIHKERKKFNEAARIFKQELGVRRKIGQADYPMIARTLNHLGVTEYEMKNNNRSLKYLTEALGIFKEQGEGSVECAEVLFNTGLVYESSRSRERAIEAYDEAARIFREHGYQDNHPHLAKARRKIEKLQPNLQRSIGPK